MTRWPTLAPYLAMVLADIGDAMLTGEFYEDERPWEGDEPIGPSNDPSAWD